MANKQLTSESSLSLADLTVDRLLSFARQDSHKRSGDSVEQRDTVATNKGFIPGLAWKHGKFYAFDKRSVVVMRLWPEMRAWRRTATKPWQPTRRWADEVLCRSPLALGEIEALHELKCELQAPYAAELMADAFFRASGGALEAFSTIPDRERRIAAGFHDRRWHVLAFMARCPGAADLLEANPALGFALASNWILHKPAVTQPLRSARALLKKPQKEIMSWLGFPATERVRRILMKISPDALNGRMLPWLRKSLHRPEFQSILCHLSVIPNQTLKFLAMPSGIHRWSPSFIHQLSEKTAATNNLNSSDAISRDYIRDWWDGCHMATQFGSRIPERFTSLSHFERWHHFLMQVDRALLMSHLNIDQEIACENFGNIRNYKFVESLRFNAPPYPGNESIRPLCDGAVLLAEGREIKNCVGTYAYKIQAGHYYVYSVLHPVRATMGIKLSGGEWKIDDIKGEGNSQNIHPDDVRKIWSLLTGV